MKDRNTILAKCFLNQRDFEFSSVGFKDSQLKWEHVYLLPDIAGFASG